MSEATDILRKHVGSYSYMSPHRQNCLEVCDEAESATAENARLRDVYEAAQVYLDSDGCLVANAGLFQALAAVADGQEPHDRDCHCGRCEQECADFVGEDHAPASCEWAEDEDGWHGSCGKWWEFFDGGPEENGLNFCMNCGKRVVVSAVGEGRAQLADKCTHCGWIICTCEDDLTDDKELK